MANNSLIMSIDVDSRLDFIKCFTNEVDLDTPLNIIIHDAPVSLNNNNHNHNHNDSNNLTNNHNNNNNNHQLDLPKPSFRPAENYEYKRRQYTAAAKNRKDPLLNGIVTTDNYYRYDEPTLDDLKNRVEYDMDEADTIWLERFNEDNVKNYNYRVTEADFEKIMDCLEKESFFERGTDGQEIDEDAVCAICYDGKGDDANQILFCDMCNLAVHQECYGVPYIPEGQWLCRRCLQSPSENVSCCLCPNKGGAFKQTDDNRWAHVICALWIPEVNFANTVFLEPIDALDQIPPARWKLKCYICQQKKSGACIQCHKTNCYQPFHVTCAQTAGLHLKVKKHKYNTPNGILSDVIKEAYCDAHTPGDSNNAGMYSDGNDEVVVTDEKKYKRWQKNKKKKMSSSRKILAEKREKAFNPVAEPKVDEAKLNLRAEELLPLKRRKSASAKEFEKDRLEILGKIKGYWIEKRRARKGVPLLRRLQVSFNSTVKANTSLNLQDSEADKFKKLRYDFEKVRLLLGEVKRREIFKKKMFAQTHSIVKTAFDVMDMDGPPID